LNIKKLNKEKEGCRTDYKWNSNIKKRRVKKTNMPNLFYYSILQQVGEGRKGDLKLGSPHKRDQKKTNMPNLFDYSILQQVGEGRKGDLKLGSPHKRDQAMPPDYKALWQQLYLIPKQRTL
jgi:hypothetical protein